MTALGIDDDDTIGTTGTVEGSGILEYRHLVDILWRDGRQHIEDVAQMQRPTALLHVELHAIEDHEGLGIAVERTDTTDKHGGSLFQVAGMHVHTDVATQFGGHLFIDRQTIAVRDKTVLSGDGSTIGIHRGKGITQQVDAHALLLVTRFDAYLLREVGWCLHEEGSSEGWHLDKKLTIIIGHGYITLVVKCLDTYTCQGQFGGVVKHNTLHIAGGVIVNNLCALRSFETRGFLLGIDVVLSISHRTCCQSNGTE